MDENGQIQCSCQDRFSGDRCQIIDNGKLKFNQILILFSQITCKALFKPTCFSFFILYLIQILIQNFNLIMKSQT